MDFIFFILFVFFRESASDVDDGGDVLWTISFSNEVFSFSRLDFYIFLLLKQQQQQQERFYDGSSGLLLLCLSAL